MEINYLGHSCFRLKGKDNTILIDPFDESVGKLAKQKCDILLNTHAHSDHNNNDVATDNKIFIENPGEYEIGGTFIYGFPTFHDDKQGTERGKNTIYLIDIEGYTVLHLGDLGHDLTKELLEKVGEVDVLMVPVGGNYTIDAKKAVNIISQIEPRFVIPMHYKTATLGKDIEIDSVDKFLDEMGAEDVKSEDKLTLSSRTNLPEETTVVILNS